MIGYSAAHKRVKAARGAARDYVCAVPGCEKMAAQWAYCNRSEYERIQVGGYGAGCKYSTSPDDYDPLCLECHRAFDFAHRAPRKTCRRGHPWERGSQGQCLPCGRLLRKKYREGVTYRG